MSTPGYIPNENIWQYAEDGCSITKRWATLISTYGETFGCPVVFANAIGEVESMAGITGKIMNPSKYKLNGHSCVIWMEML